MEKRWRSHEKRHVRPQVSPEMLNGGTPAATLAFLLCLRAWLSSREGQVNMTNGSAVLEQGTAEKGDGHVASDVAGPARAGR